MKKITVFLLTLALLIPAFAMSTSAKGATVVRDTNFALSSLGAAATATVEESDKTADKIIDGDGGTRWGFQPGDGRGDWPEAGVDVVINLGKSRTFDSVVINWEGAYASSYTIESSADGKTYTSLKTVSGDGSGEKTFKFSGGVTAQYVKIHIAERAVPDWGCSIYDVRVCATAPTYTGDNLLVGGTATAEYSESWEDKQPPLAIDGDAQTRWAMDGADWNENTGAWFKVELKEAKQISAFTLMWEAAAAKNYTVSVSNDDVTYTEVASVTDGISNEYVALLLDTPVTAKYVKIHITERATGWGLSIYEFAAYNTVKETPPTGDAIAALAGAAVILGAAVIFTAKKRKYN